MIDKNKLPDKYLVKVNKERPLWNKFAEYINKVNKDTLRFNFNYYGEANSEVVCCDYSEYYEDCTLLTLEEWDSIVNPKFVLPKKWKICANTKENATKLFPHFNRLSQGASWDINIYSHIIDWYFTFDGNQYWGKLKGVETLINYTEITVEEFFEHIVNKIDNMNTNQEIIGYKAPKDLFEGMFKKDTLYITEKGRSNYHPHNNTLDLYRIPKEIVETWEAVYKPKYQLPKIDGYQGKLIDGLIIYGNDCAKFSTQFFIDLLTVYANQNRKIKSITLNSNVVITIDQIKQIVDYINNNK